MKALRPIVAAFLPSIDWPWIFVVFQGLFASAFSYYASMNQALQWLVASIGFHLMTSLACVCFIPGQRGTRHFKQDVVVKGLAVAITAYLGSQPGLQMDVKGVSVSLGAFVAGGYIIGECLGIAQDMNDLKMPLPKIVKLILERAKEGVDNVALSDTIISAITSFTQRTDGNTKVISKTETVVTSIAPPQEKP